MPFVLYLLFVLAILGAADTLYYHEWRANLPALGKQAQSELELHALRDLVYAILFSSQGSSASLGRGENLVWYNP